MARPRPRCNEITWSGVVCARPLDENGTCAKEHRHQQADPHEPPGYRAEALEWN